jgi:hypothetical protein
MITGLQAYKTTEDALRGVKLWIAILGCDWLLLKYIISSSTPMDVHKERTYDSVELYFIQYLLAKAFINNV